MVVICNVTVIANEFRGAQNFKYIFIFYTTQTMDVLSRGTINIFHINHSIRKGEMEAYYSSMATRSVSWWPCSLICCCIS